MRDLERSQQTLFEECVRGQARDVFSPHAYTPRGGFKNARDHIEKRCFSRAIRPDQSSDGALRDLKACAVDSVKATEMLVQVLDPYHHHPMPHSARTLKPKQPEGCTFGLFLSPFKP